MKDSNLTAANDSIIPTAQPASRLRHLLATVFDGFVWMGLAFGGYVAALSLFYSEREKLVAAVMGAIYFVMPIYFLSEVFGQRSLGKRIFGVAIVAKDGTDGTKRRRMLRWAIKSSPWFAALVLRLLTIYLGEKPFVHTILARYPNTLEALVVAAIDRLLAACHLDVMSWEIVTMPPLFAIRFIAEGMVLMTILMLGYLLIVFPSRRTLLDRLSGTMVARRQKQFRGFEALPSTHRPNDRPTGRPALGH
ncbi:MAG TPA: hypothetical protein VH370_11290 [Humisphaera sp.]|jgi:uncharacterized RDD family membrane protein YckC|nr:hypothetical protein [Humisphaera sp.]